MAQSPRYDASSTASVVASSTMSWSHVLGSGSNKQILVAASAESPTAGNVAISSITFNGKALTSRVSQNFNGSGGDLGKTNSLQMWQLLEKDGLPPSGTYTIVVTFAGSVGSATGCAVSLINSQQTAPEATGVATAGSAGGSLACPTNITTVADGAMVVASGACQNTGAWSVGSGEVSRNSVSESGGNEHSQNIATKIVSPAGATTVTETHSNPERMAVVAASIAYKQPPGGGALFPAFL